MQHVLLSALLDDGGRELARAAAVVAMLIGLALLLAVAVPLVLLGTPDAGFGTVSTGGVAASVPQAPRPAAPPANVTDIADDATTPSAADARVVEVARRYLGVPYVWGGTNPATGLDCSGLVQLVFRQLGISLPRTAQDQYQAVTHVPQSALQPGDLVFFQRTYADPYAWITHVGIYIGNGQQINAPTEGQVVSIQPVFSGFWGAHYAGAGRVRGA